MFTLTLVLLGVAGLYFDYRVSVLEREMDCLRRRIARMGG